MRALNAKISSKYDAESETITLSFSGINVNFTTSNCGLYFGEKGVAVSRHTNNGKNVKFKIKVTDNLVTSIHSPIRIRNNKTVYKISCKNFPKGQTTPFKLSEDVFHDDVIAIRTTGNNENLIFSKMPDYGIDRDNLHWYNTKLIDSARNPKYVLFYEKKSEQADESGIAVFDKCYAQNPNFVFILSENYPGYRELKRKYKNQLVRKGSKQYFRVIHNAKLLVSTEQPGHLIYDRHMEFEFNDYIRTVPYIFLQHGITFLKSIESPNMKMFWKNELVNNVIKTVVSSEVEIEEFLKVGYERKDLIKTGMAGFDNIDRSSVKTKFVYMPTYRNWEEYYILNDMVEETTYYRDMIGVANTFKELGMIEQLTIIPHPKFRAAVKALEKIGCNVLESYSPIRDEVKVMITDISSVAHDAQYRGAYLIYLWNHLEEFEENFIMKTPCNEDNTNGVITRSFDDLKLALNDAESKSYIMDQKYRENFKKLCEFDDGKNSERIVDEINKVLQSLE